VHKNEDDDLDYEEEEECDCPACREARGEFDADELGLDPETDIER